MKSDLIINPLETHKCCALSDRIMFKSILLSASTVVLVLSAEAQEVGQWCDVMVPSMTSLDSLMTITAASGDSYSLVIAFEDGSKTTTKLTKRGSRYVAENRFGEYYKIQSDGRLGIHDSEGFIRAAKEARAGAKPGACR